MKDYLKRGAFEDLFIDLGMLYNARAHVAYDFLKEEYRKLLDNPPEDLEEPLSKFIEEEFNQTLDESVRLWCASIAENFKAKGSKAKGLVKAFEGEPEIFAATLLFLDFLAGKEVTVKAEFGYLTEVVMKCKLVSILFEKVLRVCDTLERAGIHPQNSWGYTTWLVRLGTMVEIKMFEAIPELELNSIKKGRTKGSQSTKENAQRKIKLLADLIYKRHKASDIGTIILSKKNWQDLLTESNNDEPVSHFETKKKRKAGAEKILSEKYKKAIKIIFE
jgi:hypothetical protein